MPREHAAGRQNGALRPIVHVPNLVPIFVVADAADKIVFDEILQDLLLFAARARFLLGSEGLLDHRLSSLQRARLAGANSHERQSPLSCATGVPYRRKRRLQFGAPTPRLAEKRQVRWSRYRHADCRYTTQTTIRTGLSPT